MPRAARARFSTRAQAERGQTRQPGARGAVGGPRSPGGKGPLSAPPLAAQCRGAGPGACPFLPPSPVWQTVGRLARGVRRRRGNVAVSEEQGVEESTLMKTHCRSGKRQFHKPALRWKGALAFIHGWASECRTPEMACGIECVCMKCSFLDREFLASSYPQEAQTSKGLRATAVGSVRAQLPAHPFLSSQGCCTRDFLTFLHGHRLPRHISDAFKTQKRSKVTLSSLASHSSKINNPAVAGLAWWVRASSR